jgi:hypothetical protein
MAARMTSVMAALPVDPVPAAPLLPNPIVDPPPPCVSGAGEPAPLPERGRVVAETGSGLVRGPML